jgi:hypothetical protein
MGLTAQRNALLWNPARILEMISGIPGQSRTALGSGRGADAK